ncbi:MAG: MFS transporter [SAR202 cluster bacterium]|nr:MFS transporter [SAR202 cluster bacterium]
MRIEPTQFSIKKLSGVFYGWWLVGIATFMLMLMSASVFQGIGTFFVALERNFGWNRTTLSGAFALARAEGALFGPVEGYLVDRLGTRRMVLIGFTIMGVGFLLFSQTHAIWHFYVAYVMISFGSGIGGWIPMVTLVNNWFSRRRAIAMAMAVSGVQFGGFLVPLVAVGIESRGFRVTTFVIGVFLLIVVYPVTRLIRNRPEEHGLVPDGLESSGDPPSEFQDVSVEETPIDSNDMTPRQAMRTVAFWAIVIARTTSVVSIVSLAVHLVPKLTDTGMSLVTANLVVMTYTSLAIPSGLLAGMIADRTSPSIVLFVCLLLQSVAVAVLAFSDSLWLALVFAVMYGIGFGGRVPLLTAIIGDYFGRRHFGTILGINMIPSNISMIIAPLFAGYMFDVNQSYFVPFASFSALGLLGTFAILFARRPAPPA